MKTVDETKLRIVAWFSEPAGANAAKSTIETILKSAKQEIDGLFSSGGGIASSADVSWICSRYGLRNCASWDWKHFLQTNGEDLIWEAPEDLNADDARSLLLSLGAVGVEILGQGDDDPPWLSHPYFMATMLCDDEIECRDRDEDDPLSGSDKQKRILH